MKKLLFVSLVILVFASCEKPHEITAEDWPQYKMDNYRSARSAIDIFDNTFGEKWIYKAPQAPVPAWYGPAKEDAYALSGPLPSMRDYDLAYYPVVVGDKLYYGSSADDALHCLSAKTGEEIWHYTTDGPIRIAPVYYEGNIYFGSDDGYVYCLDSETGKEKWRFSPVAGGKERVFNNGRFISFWPVRTGVMIEDGIAYFGASLIPWKESYLCGVDAKSGKVRGEGTYVRKLENVTFEGAMASSGDRLIQPQGRVSPVFIDRKTGRIDGQLPGTGGCFVLVTPENHVVNFQSSRYKSIWETIPGKKKPEYMSFKGGKDMVVSGDTSFVLSDHAISAYNRKTKEVIWSSKGYNAHRMIMADTVLFAGATDTVFAVSIRSGRPLWKGLVEGTVYAMAVGDSALFVSTGEGKIYKFTSGGKQMNLGEKKEFFDAGVLKERDKTLKLVSGPYMEWLDRNNVTLKLTTPAAVKCEVLWHSNGNFDGGVYKDDVAEKEHMFTLPVRRDLSYKYRIVTDNAQTKEYEYDNFFNFAVIPVHVKGDWFRDRKISDYVSDIITKTGKRKGVCLMLGLSGDQLPVELAQKSSLDVIVLDEDKDKIDTFRNKLQKEGVYGRRISAYVVEDLDNTPVQSDIADLLICSGNDIDIDEVIRVTAPYGKAVYLRNRDKEQLSKMFLERTNSSNLDWETYQDRIRLGDELAIVLTKKEPENSGEWTHQYGSADNSSFGGEDLWGTTSSEDFEIQWMGRPGPRFQTDRSGRKPAPIAVNGKMFVQGNQRVVALNAYNGTILWSKDIPGMMRMNVNHDCSNWAADNKYIYIIVKDKLLELDQETGKIVKELDVPASEKNKFDWGYVGTFNNDMVILSQSPKNSSYIDYYGGYGWYDAVKGPATEKVMSVRLSAYASGQNILKWTYYNPAGMIINSSILIYNEDIYFVESASASPLSKLKRGDERIFRKLYLVCISDGDGLLKWRKPIKNEPGITAYYMAAGNGRVVTVASKDFRYYIYNYSAKDGSLQWEAVQKWYSNNHGGHLSIPAIAGNKLLVRPVFYDLQTGEKLSLSLPKAGHGCASYTLTENSVFYRGGSITQFSLDTKKFSKWERLRPDCWISTVPALGMVLSPEGGGGCSCGNWFETSMVLAPRSRAPVMFKFDGDSRFVDSLLVEVVLKKGVEGELYYTLDGSEPTKESTIYNNPVLIDRNTDMKVALFYEKEGRERKAVREKYFERLWPAPVVETDNLITDGKRTVTISKNGQSGVVHYTLDGSVPDDRSPVFNKAIQIDKKTTIKAVTVWNEDFGDFKSEVTTITVDVPELRSAIEKETEPGLIVKYYEGTGWTILPDLDAMKPLSEEVASYISLKFARRLNDYALRFTGYINVPEDGIYTFFIKSDDGSSLYIDGIKVVNNDGVHSPQEKSGDVPLQKGLHKIMVDYFQGTEGQALGVVWQTPTSRKRRIPEEVLSH